MAANKVGIRELGEGVLIWFHGTGRRARRSLSAVWIAAFTGLSAPAVGSAQATIHVAGGATLPLGELGDYASAGWLAHAGVGFPVGDAGVSVGAAGYYGRNAHELEGDKTSLYGGLGFASYAFGGADGFSPFLVATAGLMVHSYESDSFPALEESETGLALGGGAGVAFPLGRVSGLVEGWLLNGFVGGENTTIGGVGVGVRFPLGAGM